MLPFHEAVAAEFAHLNEMIVAELHSEVGLVENIGHYIVEGGGKRLRPVSVLLASRALDGDPLLAVRMATIIEFIHTATLLHDDVVDESDRRRGRDTANELWGNSPAVLVGDFLYSRAFQLMVQLGQAEVMKVLADTTNIIAEGEVQQLINAGNPDTSEADYLNVVRKKTAILFSAATECAAIIASASPAQREAMKNYGLHLGMAFQLQDDVLDYTGDANELGKNIGDDLAEGKPTLPLIYTIAHGNAEYRNLVRDAILAKDSGRIDEVVRAVQANRALEYTQTMAEQQISLAKSQLESLNPGLYRDTLANLADFALHRSY